MHHPDRIQRQFGFCQTILHNCDTVIAFHELDLRGTKTKDWVKHHKEWIQLWDQHQTHISIGEPWVGDMHDDDPYMVWYQRITRRYISRDACTFDFVSGHLVHICNASIERSHIGTLARQALATLNEQDRFTRVPPPQPNVHAHEKAGTSDGVDSEPHTERDFASIPNLRSMLNDWCQTPIRMEDFGNVMTEQHEAGVKHSKEGVSHTTAGALHSGDGQNHPREFQPLLRQSHIVKRVDHMLMSNILGLHMHRTRRSQYLPLHSLKREVLRVEM
ncbi:hypothetical protein ACSBR2_000624 [Camellia fascicularis]